MLTAARYRELAAAFAKLRIALVGDFCLDRYLEIDPAREEVSIETGLPVHNVVNVRSQPGGAGTILNNLCALGVGKIFPVGFCGEDGEGFELLRGLSKLPGVCQEMFLQTDDRRTFTYCKPLSLEEGRPPREHSRLDSKNWTPTPEPVTEELIRRLDEHLASVDAIILLDQVDIADTGVVNSRMLRRITEITRERPDMWILADSRQGLENYPPVCLKMNAVELQTMSHVENAVSVDSAMELASDVAKKKGRHVFITMSEQGMLGASPEGDVHHVPAIVPDGPIDIVGAGDCVTANLAAALAVHASVGEALQIASVAASIVIGQLGTTGTATAEQIARRL